MYEFSIAELRRLADRLRDSVNPMDIALRERILETIFERRAIEHMIEVGSYPSWYAHKVRV